MKRLNILAIALALASLAGCGGNTGRKPALMVSIPPQKHILEQIAGDRFEVACMLEKGGSPETYDPTMEQMMQLESCKAYFLIGNMAFEDKIKERAGEIGDGIRIVNSIEGIGLIEGHHGHGDESGIDPHVWMSAANMRRMARNMAAALTEIDPAGKPAYEEALRKLDARLSALSDSLGKRLENSAGKAFVVWHPSLSYFARDYRLEQVSVEYEGKEAPIRHIERKIDRARQRGASVFLLQKGADPRQADAIARQTGMRIAEIDPLAYDWENEMKRIADEIAK